MLAAEMSMLSRHDRVGTLLVRSVSLAVLSLGVCCSVLVCQPLPAACDKMNEAHTPLCRSVLSRPLTVASCLLLLLALPTTVSATISIHRYRDSTCTAIYNNLETNFGLPWVGGIVNASVEGVGCQGGFRVTCGANYIKYQNQFSRLVRRAAARRTTTTAH